MTYKCSMCGKSFTRGAVIIFDKAYCRDCGGSIQSMVEGFEGEFVEAKLYGKPLPDVVEYLKRHEALISSAKLPKARLRAWLLRRVMDRLRALERM